MTLENTLRSPLTTPNHRVLAGVEPGKGRAAADPLAATVENVLPFYLSKYRSGQRVCLVTLYDVDSVSPRPVGSQMAVAEDGQYFGFLTGGCAEQAIVKEALNALQENRSRRIRIGKDSPWMDIKLPCGAGIDLYFSVNDGTRAAEWACDQLIQRNPVALLIDPATDQMEVVDPGESSNDRRLWVKVYEPATRLVMIGSGPYLESLAQLALQAEMQVVVWSPEPMTDRSADYPRHLLTRATRFPPTMFDAFTAVAMLFHDHDWEPELLDVILASDCFYVGALGSRTTHAHRLRRLQEMGISEDSLQRIAGPIGLPIHARTPAEIAVAILAEVIRSRNDSSPQTSGYGAI